MSRQRPVKISGSFVQESVGKMVFHKDIRDQHFTGKLVLQEIVAFMERI
jgi:hypothetical protein